MRRAAGFTLVEVMVVLVVIGIVSAAVLLSTRGPDPGRVLARESDRLALCLESAFDAAVAGPRHFGLYLNAQRYGFLVYRAGAWQAPADPPCADHAWPAGLSWRAEVEGRALPKPRPGAVLPQIYLLGSGEVSAFRIELAHAGARRVVSGTGWGEIRSAALEP